MSIRTMEVIMEKDSDSESIYMNVEDAEKNFNQTEVYDNIYLNTTTEIPGSAGACERRKVNGGNTTAVGLGFLCVLLLTVIIVLCVKHNKEMLQIQSNNDNMTTETDMLQSRYNIMTREKYQLLKLNNKLTSERNQLQSSYDTLKSERDAMQKKLTEIDSCPYGWSRFLSSCYLVSSAPNTWDRSRWECIRTGADLVIINSREEQQFVSGLKKNIWLGLTDRVQEGQWKWVDNTPLESGYWMNNEPNNAVFTYSDEDCAEVLPQAVAVMPSWNDNQCSHSAYGLCEKKIRCSTQ